MRDAELLAASARGDPDAFAMFYRRHLAQVLAFCLRETGSRETAADLTAEVFAAALEASGRYRPQSESAAGWLLGIARNKLLEGFRRRRVEDGARRRLGMRRLVFYDEDLARVDEIVALGSTAVDALDAVVPTTERDAVHARIVQERSYREIALEMRCSESLVRKRVSRGLARLRAALDK